MHPEITGTEGPIPKGEVFVVASRYNESICDELVTGAVETFASAGFDAQSIVVVRVPGAWELPAVVSQCLGAKTVGVVALGCVIKGETTHDQHINRAVSNSLMQLGLDSDIPVGFGLLTCNTLEQAIQRSGGNVGNKGNEAAEAVLEMMRLQEKLRCRSDA